MSIIGVNAAAYAKWLLEEFGGTCRLNAVTKFRERLRLLRPFAPRFSPDNTDVLIIGGFSGGKFNMTLKEKLQILKFMHDGGKCLAICDAVHQLIPIAEFVKDKRGLVLREAHTGRGFRETVVGETDVINLEHNNGAKLIWDKERPDVIPIATANDGGGYADILSFFNGRVVLSPLHAEMPPDFKLDYLRKLNSGKNIPKLGQYLEYLTENWEKSLKPFADYHAQLRQVIYEDFLGLPMRQRVAVTAAGLLKIRSHLTMLRSMDMTQLTH